MEESRPQVLINQRAITMVMVGVSALISHVQATTTLDKQDEKWENLSQAGLIDLYERIIEFKLMNTARQLKLNKFDHQHSRLSKI
mgnify:CR=1 FL=1